MKKGFDFNISKICAKTISNSHPLMANPLSVEGIGTGGDLFTFELLSRLCVRVQYKIVFPEKSRRRAYSQRIFVTLRDMKSGESITSVTHILSGSRYGDSTLMSGDERVDLKLRENQIDNSHDYEIIVSTADDFEPVIRRRRIRFFPLSENGKLFLTRIYAPVGAGLFTYDEEDRLSDRMYSALTSESEYTSLEASFALKFDPDYRHRLPVVSWSYGLHGDGNPRIPAVAETVPAPEGDGSELLAVRVNIGSRESVMDKTFLWEGKRILILTLFAVGHPIASVVFDLDAPEESCYMLDAEDLKYKFVRDQSDIFVIFQERLRRINDAIERDEHELRLREEAEMLKDGAFMEQLDRLVGLDDVKRRLRSFANLMRFRRLREEHGMAPVDMPLHSLFLGAPGTGKTTVAKMIGELLAMCKVLSKGHVVVRDRASLVGEYIGSTEARVNEAIEASAGGVLFIDEAYQLNVRDMRNDYGRQVIDTLMTALADPEKRDWMVILAGYEQPMLELLKTNPGLESRFPFSQRYRFASLEPVSLMKVAHLFCHEHGLILSAEAERKLMEHLQSVWENRSESFGNARYVVNLFETEIVLTMADRLATVETPSCEELQLILPADIPAPVVLKIKPARIGFAS